MSRTAVVVSILFAGHFTSASSAEANVFLGPWATELANSFAGEGVTIEAKYQYAQNVSRFFWTVHYDADIWHMRYWPGELCDYYPKLAQKGLNSAYGQGLLYGWIYHEVLHSCIPPADNAAGGADPKSCLHLAIDHVAHGQACGEAGAIKGDDCNEDGGGEGEREGSSGQEGEQEGESAGESQSGEQEGSGEGSGSGDLTEEEQERLEGLCDFMSDMENKWSGDGDAAQAVDCIQNHPLSQGVKDCGISYPPAPGSGSGGGSGVLGPCGCCEEA